MIDARELVPGDVLCSSEGDRISADARLLERRARGRHLDADRRVGAGRPRTAEPSTRHGPLLEARDLVFSGTTLHRRRGAGGRLRHRHADRARPHRGAVGARRAARRARSSAQVRRVAWLIAVVAVGVGVAFLPLGMLVAGLPFADAVVFAIGLLVANVPEGLLPTITLALAVGVARPGAARRAGQAPQRGRDARLDRPSSAPTRPAR